MLDVEFAQLSDRGRVREHNEDYLGYVCPATPEQARTHGWLFALADGVGGQERGEVASRLAVETLARRVSARPRRRTATSSLLPRLVQAANTRVFETGTGRAARAACAMATTLVACALRFDRAVVPMWAIRAATWIRHGRAEVAHARSHRGQRAGAAGRFHRPGSGGG